MPHISQELQVFAERVERQLKLLRAVPFSAKFGGATGQFNAHYVAVRVCEPPLVGGGRKSVLRNMETVGQTKVGKTNKQTNKQKKHTEKHSTVNNSNNPC